MDDYVNADLDALELAAQAEHLRHGGIFVPHRGPSPAPMTSIRMRLRTPAGTAEFEATVVQIIEGVGIGLQLDSELAQRKLGVLMRRAQRPETEDTVDPILRLSRLTTPQKQELAQYGDRRSRMALLKDTNKAIHPFLLRNPKLTTDEVRMIAGYRNVNPDVLQKIAHNHEWMRDGRIVSALVGNPKTPLPVAKPLLERLSLAELRRIAKSNDVPRVLATAARARLTRM